MRCFGLTPEAINARTPAAELKPVPPLRFAMVYGGLALGAVSLLAYSIWAFRLVPGAAAMYSSIAAVYIGLTGVLLSRLVRGSGTVGRFALLFAATFAVYAIFWCLFWFGLKGRYQADLFGSAFGLAAMAWLILRAFGRRDGFLPAFAVLFTFHTLGYALGDELYGAVSGSTGRLLWGAAHGIGFGAGLGSVLHYCQQRGTVAAGWQTRESQPQISVARSDAGPESVM